MINIETNENGVAIVHIGQFVYRIENVCTEASSVTEMEEEMEEIEEEMMGMEEEEEGNNDTSGLDEATLAFPWLATVIEDQDCPSLTIEEYDLGSFSFVTISTAEGSRVFFEDGTFFCANSSQTDCNQVYGLDELSLSNTWTCMDDGDSEGDEGNEGEEKEEGEEEQEQEEQEQEEEQESSSLFTDYAWLSSVIEPDCIEGTITEYLLDPFVFIFIETPESSDLYFQDGTYYCNHTATFDCISAYGLTEIGRTFTCSENLTEAETRSDNTDLFDVSLFPNPAIDRIQIKIPQDGTTVDLYSSNGTLVMRLNNLSQGLQSLDLNNLEQGLFVLRAVNGEQSVTKKVIKL